MHRLFFFIVIVFFSSCQSLNNCTSYSENFEGYNIPSYFQENILSKEQTIKRITTEHDIVSSFIFITDTHWEINSKNGPEIIRHIQNSTGVNRLFFGGDAIVGDVSKEKALTVATSIMDTFYSFENFYPVYGNHDSNLIPANINIPDTWFVENEVYLFLHSKLQFKTNVQYGNFFYYFVDAPENSTRYICLDSGRNCVSLQELVFLADA